MKTVIAGTIFTLCLILVSTGTASARQILTDNYQSNQAGDLTHQPGLDSLPDSTSFPKERQHKQKGYFNNTRLGVGVRLGMPVFSASTVNGFQFSRTFSLGLGVGYCHTYVPLWTVKKMFTVIAKSKTAVGIDELNIFIEPTIFFGRQKSSPIAFFMIDFGYSWFLSNKEQELSLDEKSDWRGAHSHPPLADLEKTSFSGGVYLAPGFGLKAVLSRNFSLNFSLQLLFSRYMTNETEEDLPGHSYGNYSLYPIFNIGIGF